MFKDDLKEIIEYEQQGNKVRMIKPVSPLKNITILEILDCDKVTIKRYKYKYAEAMKVEKFFIEYLK